MRNTVSPIAIKLKKASLILCLIVIAICLLILADYIFSTDIFSRQYLAKRITMNPLVAILTILLATATILSINELEHHRKAIRILCGIVLVMSILKGIFLLFGINIYPDRLLFYSQLYYEGIGWSSFPVSTIICYIFFASAILMIDYEIGKDKIRPAQFLCFFNIFIVVIQLYAWVYQILFILVALQIAINTAICIFLLALAILFARADTGTTQNLVGSYSAENTVLRILALIIPLLIGWLRIKGETLGYVSKEMGTALFAIASFLISIALLSRNAFLQDKSRKAKELAAEKIKENEDRLKEVLENISEGAGVANVKGEFIFYNKVSYNLFGKEAWYIPKKLNTDEYSYFYPDGVTKIKPTKLPIFRAIIGETVEGMRIMVKNKDYPEGIMLRVKAMPLKNKKGKIQEGITIFRDISYKDNISNLFVNEEKRSKAIIKNLNKGIVIIDLKDKTHYFNRKAKELLGKDINTDLTIDKWPEYYGIYKTDEDLFLPSDLPFFKTNSENEGELIIKNDTLKDSILLKYRTILIVDDYGELFSIATFLNKI